MDYKEETRKTYDSYAKAFDEKFEDYFRTRVQPEADIFLSYLKGPRILDLGSGAGAHSSYFKSKGFEPVCVDISEEMVKLCKDKGLQAFVGDIEDLKFPKASFDGILCYASLLHIPKVKVPGIITNLTSFLSPNGVFAIALKEGEKEGFETHEKYPGTKRWFSYFTDSEVKSFFQKDYDLLHTSKTEKAGKYTFLNYVFRRK